MPHQQNNEQQYDTCIACDFVLLEATQTQPELLNGLDMAYCPNNLCKRYGLFALSKGELEASPAPAAGQNDLIDSVTDPATIAQAVEGSMDKRLAVLDGGQRDVPEQPSITNGAVSKDEYVKLAEEVARIQGKQLTDDGSLRERLGDVKYSDDPGFLGSLAANMPPEAYDNLLDFIAAEIGRVADEAASRIYDYMLRHPVIPRRSEEELVAGIKQIIMEERS